MKKNIAALTMMLFLAATSVSFAGGYGHRGHGGYYNGHYGGGYHHNGYRNGPRHYNYRGHHNNGVGIAMGVVGGLLLGSALIAATPPQTVVCGAPYATYPPEVVVRQPRVCVEDRVVEGEWQINRYDGRRFWAPYQYPVTRRFQVPCN
ncbi:hypothetical protein [Desulforhopalus sp. IMCC35007]|uniref:hypothetical protein n=1 Tax=Desulforhopalus sp. IMCC35007 TaxID=2569543 RepID=UPI0010AE7FF2|nr:hypothetical protein [Desulforhopalus sp. IMCC35007]TKB05750.1 hypothetical protein FCL48_23735 [Desulforhopalus sp. IMCC35007]